MKKEQAGFTLIEIIITTAILAVGIVAILNMFPLGIQIAGFSQKTTAAVYLAQEKIENQISRAYADLSVSEITEDYGTISEFQGYKRLTSVVCLDASDLSTAACDYDLVNDPYPMKKVNVDVSWRSSFGGEEKINLSSIVSRR
ncbi:MAG: prepilin-type N-terminal cleavage/methylation domain-containing protein [Candidatus Nealsonbacteria bacterium]|nr:prepilin-type N-terminal cleavage/methylation domain-containing protein [Candidatus Nealsonbacteria bacterium]